MDSVKCLFCNKNVSWCHMALECDGCGGWIHLRCQSTITKEEYKKAAETDTEIQFVCTICKESAITPQEVMSHEENGEDDHVYMDVDAPTGIAAFVDEPSYMSDNSSGLSMDGSSHETTPDELTIARAIAEEESSDEDETEEPEEVLLPQISEEPTVEAPATVLPEPVPLPQILDEPSLDEPAIREISDCSSPLATQYSIVENGTRAGKKKLVDSMGYTYNIKEKGKTYTSWQCSVRTKKLYCKATITQRGETFTPGLRKHVHPAEVGALEATKIVAAVKRKARDDLFRPASAIVQEVLAEELQPDKPCPALARPSSIARAANRTRQKNRPKDPQSLDFAIAENCIPDGFLKVKVQGCAFHWTQAVWRKVQELGLARAYQEDNGTYSYIRRLLALPFLPDREIPVEFARLVPEATTEPLKQLTTYIEDNWVKSSTFPAENWSIYGQPIRTNNDVEGFHNALNRRACGKIHLPFYMLVQLLFNECKVTDMTIRLVSEDKVKRIQRKKYRDLQRKIFTNWEDYASKKKSAKQLLKSCSYLNGPIRE